MAVSERGGKNNSGEYKFKTDSKGKFIENKQGNPILDQDLVNYELTKEELENIDKVASDDVRVAEAFIQFAKQQKLPFWGD